MGRASERLKRSPTLVWEILKKGEEFGVFLKTLQDPVLVLLFNSPKFRGFVEFGTSKQSNDLPSLSPLLPFPPMFVTFGGHGREKGV